VRIDVQPASTAAAGVAAAELAASLRRASERLQATGPMPTGTATSSAWAATWATLRTVLPGLAVAAEDLATTSRAAAARLLETERGLVPDGQ
jgi:hypothetical protein